MAHLRRALGPLTAIWLFCQVGAVALVPIAQWTSAADSHAGECTCGHGPGAMCPMHHKPTGGGSAPCAMQAANGPGTAVLTTVAGIHGFLPASAISIGPADAATHHADADVRVAGRRPIPPDPPPPRL